MRRLLGIVLATGCAATESPALSICPDDIDIPLQPPIHRNAWQRVAPGAVDGSVSVACSDGCAGATQTGPARVALVREDPPFAVRTVVEHGRFAFDDVPPDDYWLVVDYAQSVWRFAVRVDEDGFHSPSEREGEVGLNSPLIGRLDVTDIRFAQGAAQIQLHPEYRSACPVVRNGWRDWSESLFDGEDTNAWHGPGRHAPARIRRVEADASRG